MKNLVSVAETVNFVMGGAGFWFVFLSGFATATVLILGLGAAAPVRISNFDPETEEGVLRDDGGGKWPVIRRRPIPSTREGSASELKDLLTQTLGGDLAVLFLYLYTDGRSAKIFGCN